jgi:hypothetical protein
VNYLTEQKSLKRHGRVIFPSISPEGGIPLSTREHLVPALRRKQQSFSDCDDMTPAAKIKSRREVGDYF